MNSKAKERWLFLLGVAICLSVAAVSVLLERLIPGELLGASIIALFLGTIINSFFHPSWMKPALKFTSKKILKIAIILLGASLSVKTIMSVGKMTFFEPDTKTFPLLSLAKEVHKAGGLLPAVLNAANEEAVYAFLAKKIGFADIGYIVSDFVHSYENKADPTLDEIENASQTVRRKIRERLAQKEQ